MTPLRQARRAALPAAALAAWGVTIWLDTLGSVDVDRDDLCPAMLAIILSVSAIVQALLEHTYRRFWRESQAVKFEHALESVAEGVAAYMRQDSGDGDGQRAPGPRTGA